VAKKVDVLAIGYRPRPHSRVMAAIKNIKSKMPEVQLTAGNVATYEGARELAALGVDGIKVGIGPGSICTTRVVSGAGVPQITAISEMLARQPRSGHPADCRWRHQVLRAISPKPSQAGRRRGDDRQPAGGHRRKPRRDHLYQGRTFKTYRGMGSLGAMSAGQSNRYEQDPNAKLVPEGIEGRVASKGPLSDFVYQTGLAA